MRSGFRWFVSSGLFPDLREAVVDKRVVFFFVGESAVGTVFDPAFGIAEISSAGLSQTVERTVTEQAVKLLRIQAGVTGEVFTVPVLKKCIVPGLVFCHGFSSSLITCVHYNRCRSGWISFFGGNCHLCGNTLE